MNATTWTIYREYLDQVGEPNAAAALTLADALQSARDAGGAETSTSALPAPLTVAEAAKRLRLSSKTVYQMCLVAG